MSVPSICPQRAARPTRAGTASDARDEGVVSLFVVVAMLALMLAIGLVVDGGRKVLALQRADTIAQEAARTASQQIIPAPSVRGQAPQLDAAAAERAAATYLAGAASSAQEQVEGSGTATGTDVEVTVTVTEPTTFLSAVGIDSVSATAHASARLVRGLDKEVP